jgi:hypothetical protein
MSFLPMILNTAQTMANDPGNKYFLPGVLASISGDNAQGKLLPVEAQAWPVGPIGGVPGQTIASAFEANWLTYLEKVEKLNISGQDAIPQPATPEPVLNLGGAAQPIQIIGLQNVKVANVSELTATDDDYRITMTLVLNAWPDYPPMSISAPYALSQDICLANTGSGTCNGNASTDINGSGSADVRILGAAISADANIGITGQDTARQLVVSLNAVKLVGDGAGVTPSLNVDSLTIDASVSQFLLNVWKNAATQAITSQDGCSAIFTQIEAALNSANNLGSLSSTLTAQLRSVLDGAFDTVSAGSLPSHPQVPGVNQVDQYLVDRATYSLNTQGSDFYLPQLITSISNPQLEPLQISTISVPDISIPVLGVTATQVGLSQVSVVGLSNLLTPAAQMVFQPHRLSFVAALGTLNPPPVFPGQATQVPAPPMQLKGSFSMTITGTVVAGSIAITLNQPTLSVTVDSEGDKLDNLQLHFSTLSIGVADPKDLVIAVQLDSAFQGMINEALNTPSIQTQILEAVNGAVQDNLGQISSAVTTEVVKLLHARLG